MSGRKPPADQARFRDGKVQVQGRLAEPHRDDGKIECLGMLFDSEENRRAFFVEELLKKLQDVDFRKTPGFPIGDDEAILRLSDPPYYTACPNPFITRILEQWTNLGSNESSARVTEPFAFDVDEGKNDPIYNAHTYPTKVPHKAIMRYLLHYTRSGDIILDAFAGTGMTGVAAQACGNLEEVQELGLGIDIDAQVGPRKAILVDLSPLATSISHALNKLADVDGFIEEARALIDAAEAECKWMWETKDPKTDVDGQIECVVWSDVFVCPECGGQIVFYHAAVNPETGEVAEVFSCPHCGSSLGKRGLSRALETTIDRYLERAIALPKRIPVLIKYRTGDGIHEKEPDVEDREILRRVAEQHPDKLVPTSPLMFNGDEWGDLQRGYHEGITHSHHFYFDRILFALAAFLRHIEEKGQQKELLRLLFTSQLINLSKMNRYRPGVSFPYNPMSGTLYVGSQISESNPFTAYRNKIRKLAVAKHRKQEAHDIVTSTQSSTSLMGVPDEYVDYIFVDPPFGDNLPYAELNFLCEDWLGVVTAQEEEAIVSEHQGKDLFEYAKLMRLCFGEMFRCLKPGRWLTVEFHNSRNSIWHGIQEAIGAAGFVVADVRILDKGGMTKKQISGANAVSKDLVISAYKPSDKFEKAFRMRAGSAEAVWEFTRSHLEYLPIFVGTPSGKAEVNSERQAHLLFDRMVAVHVQRGTAVPMSASDFYAGLSQRFPERDGMYFLPEQVAEYDRKRRDVKELVQLQVVVTDESSAIRWLRQRIGEKPQTFQELHPEFMKEIAAWQKHEKPVELMDMLRENFVQYDGEGEVPAPVHAYLSSNYHELRNLPKGDPQLREKAKDRWYVPDPKKAGDLEKVRERELLREFAAITSAKGRVKQLRTEAARVGFKTLWEQGDYQAIVDVAGKLPTNVVEEDPHLLMYLDLARSRLE